METLTQERNPMTPEQLTEKIKGLYEAREHLELHLRYFQWIEAGGGEREMGRLITEQVKLNLQAARMKNHISKAPQAIPALRARIDQLEAEIKGLRKARIEAHKPEPKAANASYVRLVEQATHLSEAERAVLLQALKGAKG